MKVDYGANARLSVLGMPDFCSAPWGQPMVLAFSCTAEDAVWTGTQSFGPRSMGHTSAEFFPPSQFLFLYLFGTSVDLVVPSAAGNQRFPCGGRGCSTATPPTRTSTSAVARRWC